MHHFQYRGDQLMCEEVPIDRIAQEVGTPFYLYSHATLTHHFRVFNHAFADVDISSRRNESAPPAEVEVS